MKWYMRIMKYILSLLHVFYIGVLAIIFLIGGIFSPTARMIGLVLLVGWLIYGLIDQLILNTTLKKNPELVEIVNTIMAQEGVNSARYAVGQEIVFSEIPSDNMKLVGKCLDERGSSWSVRLLYEDSYQIFDWDIRYNDMISPTMKALKDVVAHEKDLLVKCYCTDKDGITRAQLHLLKRKGSIYEDICLDMVKLLEDIKNHYRMEYDIQCKKIHLVQDQEDDVFAKQEIQIDNSDYEDEISNMVYGNTVMFDMDRMFVKISIGAVFKNMTVGQFGEYYVVGKIHLAQDSIYVGEIHIEISK